MDPLTIAALTLEGIKVGKGIYDYTQGNQLATTPRPTYGIPSAETEYLNRAKNLTTASLPGRTQTEDNIEGGTAASIRSLTQAGDNPSAIMAAVASLSANQNNAFNKLGVEDAQFKLGNEQNYEGALQGEAAYQEKAFDYNQNQPYQNALTAARALKGSAIQNIYSGATDASGTAFGSAGTGTLGTDLSKLTPQQLMMWQMLNK